VFRPGDSGQPQSGESSASVASSAPVRVADYIAARIREHGIRHVFMLTGGGAMHLNDALGRAEGLQYPPRFRAALATAERLGPAARDLAAALRAT